jgi:hypothetical protein
MEERMSKRVKCICTCCNTSFASEPQRKTGNYPSLVNEDTTKAMIQHNVPSQSIQSDHFHNATARLCLESKHILRFYASKTKLEEMNMKSLERSNNF